MFSVFTKLADWLVYGLLSLPQDVSGTESLHFFIEDTSKIFVMLTLLMFFVGIFRSWISPEAVRGWLQGKPKSLAYLMAVLLGAITPFCSCSSIPLFIAFVSAGIPIGVTMAFLVTSPMVNEVAVILFGEAIGWQFTALYVLSGMAVGILGGVLVDLFKLERWVEGFVLQVEAPDQSLQESKLTLQTRLRLAWHETRDILKRVWLYVLLGVGLGAVIHGYVPQEWFIKHASAQHIWAVPLSVLVAIPLYSNVTGAVPVAEVLIQKGLPVGTTLAFIMSTVAISLPELLILRKVLKPQMLIFFVAYLSVAFIAIGYLFNGFFG
ncbi:MAG: permease [Myxococcales bacterium]|nr:MAG: permease [Myxococcales bacterium]